MAKKVYIGTAPAIKQVWSAAVGSHTTGHTFVITFTDLDDGGTTVFTYIATAADTTDDLVAASLAAALNNDPRLLCQRVSATVVTNVVTLTAKTSGQPFSAATSGTGTWSIAGATTIAASGPNLYNLGANWQDGSVPGASDDVFFPAGAPSVLYGLDGTGVTLASFETQEGWNGNAGRFEGGRLFYLRIKTAILKIAGAGNLVAIDTGSTSVAVTVDHTGVPSAPGRNTVYLKGSAIAAPQFNRGNVGVAMQGGETATITGDFVALAGTLYLGIGTTVSGTTCVVGDATVRTWASVPIAHIRGASGIWMQEAGAPTTLTADRGTVEYNTTSTGTTVNLYNDAKLKNLKNLLAKALTTVNVYGESVKIFDPQKKIAIGALNTFGRRESPYAVAA